MPFDLAFKIVSGSGGITSLFVLDQQTATQHDIKELKLGQFRSRKSLFSLILQIGCKPRKIASIIPIFSVSQTKNRQEGAFQWTVAFMTQLSP